MNVGCKVITQNSIFDTPQASLADESKIKETDRSLIENSKWYDDSELLRHNKNSMVNQSKGALEGLIPFDAIKVHKLLYRFQFSNIIAGVISTIGVWVWALEHEIYLTENKSNSEDFRIMLLSFNILINLLLAIQITMSYLIWIEYSYRSGVMFKQTTIFDKEIFKVYILEIGLNMITPYPWFVGVTYPSHSLNNKEHTYMNTPLLIFMMWLRTYHLAKMLIYRSMYMSSRAERVNKMFSISWGYMFAIRWEFKQHSFSIVLSMFAYWWLTLGFLFRWSEEQVKDSLDPGSREFSITNWWWIMFITMTSVGYGELSPISETGKFVSVIAAFMGVILQALMVISTYQFFEFTHCEKVWLWLRNIIVKKQKLKKAAAILALSVFKHK